MPPSSPSSSRSAKSPGTGDLFAGTERDDDAAPDAARDSRPIGVPRSAGGDGPALTAFCDGGARGNPGPAGYGAEVSDAAGNVVAELSEFLGVQTNNVAEYRGLLACLRYAVEHRARSLEVVSDSLLMVKQIQGHYKVKSPDLLPLWQEARGHIAKLGRFEIRHALRHKNKAADRLANEAMDRGTKRPHAPGAPAPEPLRATPYPQRSEAPAAPARLDPRARRSEEAPVTHTDCPAPVPIVRHGRNPAVHKPETTPPEMLRGFTRGGVVHILGSHALPDGCFVKIIPE